MRGGAVRIWQKRRDNGGLSVGDDAREDDSRIIDLRARLGGKRAHDAQSGQGDNYAAWFRQLRESAEPMPRATAPASPAPSERLAAARRRAASAAEPAHGTGRSHDTTAMHDTTKVHDTSRVHDTAQVHDTTARRDEIDLRTPVVRAAPRPSAAPEAPAPGRETERQAPDAPALSSWEHGARDDLNERLASIQRQLRSAGISATTAPAPAPALVPEPEPPAGSARPASPRPGRPLVLIATVAVCLLLAVSAGLAITTGGDDGSPETPALTRQQSSRLADWLRANTRQDAVIAAPANLRLRLGAGLRGRQVVTIADPAVRPDLIVLPRASEPPFPVRAVARLWTSWSRAVEVLEPLPNGESRQVELNRRIDAGRRLVKSVNLRLTPRAWTMLANGKVDLSVSSLLRRLLRTHTVEVSSFPRDLLTTAAGAPARTVHITSLDGATPDAGLIQTVRAPGTRTHVGRDRGRPALVVDLPIASQG
jgi:hypothetical protein